MSALCGTSRKRNYDENDKDEEEIIGFKTTIDYYDELLEQCKYHLSFRNLANVKHKKTKAE